MRVLTNDIMQYVASSGISLLSRLMDLLNEMFTRCHNDCESQARGPGEEFHVPRAGGARPGCTPPKAGRSELGCGNLPLIYEVTSPELLQLFMQQLSKDQVIRSGSIAITIECVCSNNISIQ